MPSPATNGGPFWPRSWWNGDRPSTDEVAWLQPIPDSLIEPISLHGADPETMVLSRETIEIAFLTVIQLLTPQQRAALILCDVLGWSAKKPPGFWRSAPRRSTAPCSGRA